MYSFVLTTYNDAERAVESFKSLKETIPPGTQYKVVVVDGGSTQDQLDILKEEIGGVMETQFPDLSEALNAGIYLSLGYYHDNIQSFDDLSKALVDHVFWIHTDCKYRDYDWAGKLCWIYDCLFPMFGRLGPATKNIDGSDPNLSVLRGGNQCPLLLGKQVIYEMIKKYGYVYNPNFKNIGGYEDWDCGQRLLQLGYGFGICSLVDVWHEGMGTRKLRNTTPDQVYNGNLYHSIWKTWNQPAFELDLTEIGQKLREDFEKEYENVWYKTVDR